METSTTSKDVMRGRLWSVAPFGRQSSTLCGGRSDSSGPQCFAVAAAQARRHQTTPHLRLHNQCHCSEPHTAGNSPAAAPFRGHLRAPSTEPEEGTLHTAGMEDTCSKLRLSLQICICTRWLRTRGAEGWGLACKGAQPPPEGGDARV